MEACVVDANLDFRLCIKLWLDKIVVGIWRIIEHKRLHRSLKSKPIKYLRKITTKYHHIDITWALLVIGNLIVYSRAPG